jgi:hypothetical protein
LQGKVDVVGDEFARALRERFASAPEAMAAGFNGLLVVVADGTGNVV